MSNQEAALQELITKLENCDRDDSHDLNKTLLYGLARTEGWRAFYAGSRPAGNLKDALLVCKFLEAPIEPEDDSPAKFCIKLCRWRIENPEVESLTSD